MAKTKKQKKKEDQKHYIAYTDGSALQNPGAGGYGAVVRCGDGEEVTLSKGYKRTTNNRMEIMGVIAVLEKFGPNQSFDIHTDSTYVMNGCRSWVKYWARNNWFTFGGTPVKNADLWMRVKHLLDTNKVKVFKVKAHSGVYLNEKADELAKEAAKNDAMEDDVGFV